MASRNNAEQNSIPVELTRVAERWLKKERVAPPVDMQQSSGNHVLLIQEAYGLFAERSDLRSQTLGILREAVVLELESQDQEHNGIPIGRRFQAISEEWDLFLSEGGQTGALSLAEKRKLINKGEANALLPQLVNGQTDTQTVNGNQEGIGKIETRLNEIFSTPGVYEDFKRDLSHQVDLRRKTLEHATLLRLGQGVDLFIRKVCRRAYIEGHSLTTVERTEIEKNRILKDDADKRAKALASDPEVFDSVRIAELQKYRRQLRQDNYAETPSRQRYVERIEEAWANGKKVLLTGETGTGKTELVKHASMRLFRVKPQFAPGSQDLSTYHILGKGGLDKDGSHFEEGPLILAMRKRMENGWKGQPFLFDELDRASNEVVIGLKAILNIKPGERKQQIVPDIPPFDIGINYAFAATANIKSGKHPTATNVDPAILRVLDAPIEIDYMPASEVYDICLASIMDGRGGIPLSEYDATVTLQNLCNAASWIQAAYQGRDVEIDKLKHTVLEARNQASTGRTASLEKALLDPGRTIGMLNGWAFAQIQGLSFEQYLNTKIVEFISSRGFSSDDRYYLTEIFMLNGFLRNVPKDELPVPDLDEKVIKKWTGASTMRSHSQTDYLPAGKVAKLDPYKRLSRPVDLDLAEGLEQVEPYESFETSEAKEIMGNDFFGPDEVEKALGFKIDKSVIPAIPFSEQELRDAKANGQYLLLYVVAKDDGTPITMQELIVTLQARATNADKDKTLWDKIINKFGDEDFFTIETPRPAWRLITKDIVPDSENHSHPGQTESIVNYLKNTLYKGRTIPIIYQEAMTEFEAQKSSIRGLSPKEAAKKLAGLKINQITRQSPVEVVYASLVYSRNKRVKLLKEDSTWTNKQALNGGIVAVGFGDDDSINITTNPPSSGNFSTGVVLSR